jgi:hypothetical protein
VLILGTVSKDNISLESIHLLRTVERDRPSSRYIALADQVSSFGPDPDFSKQILSTGTGYLPIIKSGSGTISTEKVMDVQNPKKNSNLDQQHWCQPVLRNLAILPRFRFRFRVPIFPPTVPAPVPAPVPVQVPVPTFKCKLFL